MLVVKMPGLVNTYGCVSKTRTMATPMAIATVKRAVTMRRTVASSGSRSVAARTSARRAGSIFG